MYEYIHENIQQFYDYQSKENKSKEYNKKNLLRFHQTQKTKV